MCLKEYVFLFRHDGSLKAFPRQYWQLLLDKKQTLTAAASQAQSFIEITIGKNSTGTTTLTSLKSWQLNFDAFGYVDKSQWQMLETGELSQPLQELSLVPNKDNTQLGHYIDALINDGYRSDTLDNNQHHDDEEFVAQLLAQPKRELTSIQ